MPLNLLLIYDCIYPESLGGVEHRNYNLAQALAQRGHRVTLAGWVRNPQSPHPAITIQPMAYQTKLYDASGKRGILTTLKFALACLKLDLKDFDIVETANIPYLHLFPLWLLCRRHKKPLVVTWHEYFGPLWHQYKPGPIAYLFKFVERRAAQLGKVNSVSPLTAERLAAHRRDKSLILVIPNGVDLAAIHTAFAHPHPEPIDLLYAGRLMQEKRLDLVLRALPLLAEKSGFVIIGDGPDRARLETLTRELGLSYQVKFLGRLPEVSDMWRYLASASIAVQPSAREGFGMFPLEAMALGVPVLYCASPDNAVAAIVRDGVDGICAAPEPQAVADAIHKLLREPRLRLTLSRNAKVRAESYDWNEIARRIETLFEASRR